MQRRQGQVQQQPVYWLCAHRYTGSMTLIQAMKGNMGDPQNQEMKQYFTLLRKSDEAIVVKKRL